MTNDEVLAEFRAAGALLEGHFILSSGLRSPVFLQKMRVFEDPPRAERLCAALAEVIRREVGEVDIVVSPAIGGIIPGYETARALGCKAVFVERDGGTFVLRRGFEIPAGARVVLVEDIVSTGLSLREALDVVQQYPGQILAAACLIDRSGGRADIGVPLVALAQVDFPAYPADALPPELAALPPEKPGQPCGMTGSTRTAAIFHLSFPVHDLEEAARFYTEALGGVRGRHEAAWTDIALFGTQLTLQHAPQDVPQPMPRSRHFGATLPWLEWEDLVSKLDDFVEPPRIDYKGTDREQAKAMVQDPSGNLIELKAYRQPRAVLGVLAGEQA